MLCIHNSPKKQRDKAELSCKKGHFFTRTLSALKRDDSCRECTIIEMREKAKSDFIKKAKVWGFVYIDGYSGKKSKVSMLCEKCNNIFSMQAESIVKNKRCPKCKYQYHGDFGKKQKSKTIKEIAKEKGIEVINLGNTKEDKSIFRCSRGHIFETRNKVFRHNPYCRVCRKNKKEFDRKEYFSRVLVEHGLFAANPPENNTEKFIVECEHGHRYETTIVNLHPEYNCKECTNTKMSECRRLPITDVKKKLEEIGMEYISGDYINQKSIIKCKCRNKGHFVEKSFGEIYYTNKGCVKCRLSETQSSKEKELASYVKSLIDCEVGNRSVLDGKEIDILIEKKKIGIEFDGIYWHSDISGKSSQYHLDKTIKASAKGYQLIHIFENEWDTKREIIKDIIRVKLGLGNRVYARDTIVKLVEKEEEKSFFNRNHIGGFHGSSFCIGLYHNGSLVMAASFSKSRFSKEAKYELIRMASAGATVVVGGLSKILKQYDKKTNCASLITYADLRFSNYDVRNTGYAKAGFKFKGYTKPNYYYFLPSDTSTLYSRQKFQKHRLKSKLEKFDETLTEVENMHANGYGRIFDCGNFVFLR